MQKIVFQTFLLVILAVTVFMTGCDKAEPMTASRLKKITENLDSLVSEESIYISDDQGNRLENQTVKLRETFWVGGSFRYRGKISEIAAFMVDISRNNRDDELVSHASAAGKFKYYEDSDRVRFLVEIYAPAKTGEFTLSAIVLAQKFIESKITVVRKKKK